MIGRYRASETTVDERSSTRYGRNPITIGEQPDYVVNRIDEGDVATVDGSGDAITVTDVRVVPPSVGGKTPPDQR